MKTYIVLYIDADALIGDPIEAFKCQADDVDHAEEQCENAYPNCGIVWVWDGPNADEAFQDYWNNGMPD